MDQSNLVKSILFYALGYIKSIVLVWVVLPTLASVFFIWTAFSTTLELHWIKYFSFLNPAYGTGTFKLDGIDIMRIFGIISLGFFCISELLRLIGVKIKISSRVVVTLLSSIFGVAVFLAFFPTDLLNTITLSKYGEFSLVFIIFWLVTLIAYAIWYGLNILTTKLS